MFHTSSTNEIKRSFIFIADLSKANNKSIEEVEKDFFKNMRPTSLLQRFASIEEIADTVVYYSSPLASATNGAAIRVEDGLSIL